MSTPPAAPADPQTVQARSGAKAVGGRHQLQVVLLDDDPDQLLLCKRALECLAGADVVVSTYTDPALALQRIALETAPVIVVVDVHLPPLGGPEVVRVLRSRPELQPLTILMLSSSVAAVDIDRSRSAGADAYLLKPGSALSWNEVAHRVLGGWRQTNLLLNEHGH